MDYRQLDSCNLEMNRRASSPSQGQRVVLQLINKEVPLHGRQTWQPHSTQETMGTPSNTRGHDFHDVLFSGHWEQSPQCIALAQLMKTLHAITESSALTRHRQSTFSYLNTEVNSSG